MAKPYKIRNKSTGEVIEFDFDGTPTKADIDRIISERKAKQPENRFNPPIDAGDNRIASPVVNQPEAPTFNKDVPQYPRIGDMVKRGANWATTSLMPDVEQDFTGYVRNKLGDFPADVTNFIVGGATSPLGLATAGMGTGLLKYASKFRKATPLVNAAEAEIPVVKAAYRSTPDEVLRAATAKPKYKLILDAEGRTIGHEAVSPSTIRTGPLPEFQEIGDAIPNKPYKTLKTEYQIYKNTEEKAGRTPISINQWGKLDPKTGKVPPKIDAPVKVHRLPNDLAGAKPKFNIGYNSYEPMFESDIDKALYIIAQNKPSARDADYMKFLKNATGLDDNAIRMEGKKIRSSIKNSVAGQQAGPVKIGNIYKPPEAPMSAIIPGTPEKGTWLPPFDEMVANASGGGKPPIKPPVVTAEPLAEFKPELPKVDINKGTTLNKAINFPKSTWASIDLSAPLRQGKGLIHKSEYWGSIKPMFKSLASEDSFRAAENAIKAKPTYKLQVDSGLALSDLADITKREEAIMSSWAEAIPGVRASNRAYTTFLNKLRSDTFDNLVATATKGDLKTDPKAIASFINNATGRGSLGKYEKNAVDLNNVFFSPRFISSRLNMLASPVTYAKAPPQVQKEVVKSLVATTSYWATAAGLAKLAGAEVNMDPSNSDFGKIKVGDTRIDTLAGYQQYIRTAYQVLSGEKTSPTTGKTKVLGEGYRPETRKDVLESFARSKMSPAAGTVYDLAKGKTIAGKPVLDEMTRPDMDNYFAKMMVPNMFQTMRELYKEDPSLFSGFAGAAALFGEGVQVFDDYVPSSKRNRYLSQR